MQRKPEAGTFRDETGRLQLLGMTLDELVSFVRELDLPAYRGRQLYNWIYAKRATSFEEMTSLPEELRKGLGERGALRTLQALDHRESPDGTVKFLFRTSDGLNVESVLIPSEARDDQDEPRRRTLCLSSQVGCPLDCKFCATATMKLKRNLAAAEILEQHLRVEEIVGERITNIVYMGMGEPLLNYDQVFRSVDLFSDPANELVPASRITISTSGVLPGILRMAEEQQKVKLALSLHATTEGLRDRLMPINRKYPLPEVLKGIDEYYRSTRKGVTYEYILFESLNDSQEDARRLARIARRVPSRVNVIPFHPIDFTDPTGFSATLKPASPERFERFISMLRNEGVAVMVRSSSGVAIEAACGQLAIRHEAEALA